MHLCTARIGIDCGLNFKIMQRRMGFWILNLVLPDFVILAHWPTGL